MSADVGAPPPSRAEAQRVVATQIFSAREAGGFGNFRDLSCEHGWESLRVEGEIPDDLRGTLYRNGPSLFSTAGRAYRHWFDGDGAVSAVRFGEGRIEGAVKLVQSRGLLRERAEGRAIFGAYGTPAPSWLRRLGASGMKNAANTSVWKHAGRLFALFEGGQPTEIDPDSLDTMGERDLDGAVIQSFSAHPHRVPSRSTTYNFGVRYGRVTHLDLFAMPDGGGVSRVASLALSGAPMVHDFIATEEHLIFFVSPLRLSVLRMLAGSGAYCENLAWKPDLGTEILIVSIDDPSQVTRVEAPSFFQWHFANAFERGSEIVVDLVSYPDFEINGWLGAAVRGGDGSTARGELHRATIDFKKRSFRTDVVLARSCEFPRISPRFETSKHRMIYVGAHSSIEAATGMFDTLLKVDVTRGDTQRFDLGGAHRYPSEAIFVPRINGTDEDDGYLVTLVYDARSDTSHVAVLDAQNPSRTAIATAHFDHRIPFTFHGIWAG